VQHLPEQFTKHSVVVNGTRIAVVVGGTGEPVLLLHGWPQTADAWNKVMGPLAARLEGNRSRLAGNRRLRTCHQRLRQR
jgi:pimeloyl-ACP methyl ester carboxylesterase